MWGKIAIGMRCYSDPKADFFSCFIKLIYGGLWKNDEVLEPILRGNIIYALKKVCDNFLETKCDSLFLLEDDIVFKPDDLAKLRQSGKEYGIISALFPARRHPFNPQVFRSVRRSLNSIDNLMGIIDVEAVPFGFCLIRREVIEKIWERNKGRNEHWSLRDECMSFCEDARILNFKIGVNTDVSIGHLAPGVKVFWNKENNKPEIKYDNFND